MAMPASMRDSVPKPADFTPFEKMRGEYETIDIYPNGRLMEFARPNLPRDVLTCAAAGTRQKSKPSGWPIARQHPKGRGGAVFITMEDETGDTQLLVRLDVYERCRRALDGQVVIVWGKTAH